MFSSVPVLSFVFDFLLVTFISLIYFLFLPQDRRGREQRMKIMGPRKTGAGGGGLERGSAKKNRIQVNEKLCAKSRTM
jgi:hypothetical protein